MNPYLQKLGTALTKIDRKTVNQINAIASAIVFGTGLVLFFEFHVGRGPFRSEWFWLRKCFWLTIHQTAAMAFLVGFGAHVLNNRKYITTIMARWGSSLPGKIKKTSREQLALFSVAMCVLFTGFYPWITMPGAPLRDRSYHVWIDMHMVLGIAFLIGSAVHIARRWRRLLQ